MDLDTFKPTFLIQIEGQDLSKDITQEITSFVFTDNEEELDVLQLSVTDRNLQFVDDPQEGNEIVARFGYVGNLSPRKKAVIKDIDYDFPENGDPTIRIKAYDKGFKLAGKENQKVWQKPAPGILYSEIAEQIAAANGLQPTDPALDRILSQKEPGVLNTVINLETGSLAVEAALKMMLSRFYTIDGAPAQYAGRVPVFVVMADNAGGVTGNYHGTTVLAQTLRGLWPDFYTAAQKNELYKVVSVPINDSGAFAETMRRWNEGKYKTAGFCHEIVLMNYGGIRLSEEYLQAAYKVCRATDTPVLCDEIQSCAWYDGLFLFRKYGLTPDFVSVGKGFPGGVYPASKILTSAAFDSLSQFGALVTNGQEELASLAYLVTMEFIGANGAHIEAAGRYYHEQVRALAQKYPQVCTGVEGDAHMTALCFDSVDDAVDFCTRMNRDRCVDISAQTYKPNCPPVALTKLPLITTETMAGRLVALFDSALAETAAQKGAAL